MPGVNSRRFAARKKKPGGSGPPDSSGGNAQRGHRTATQPTLYQHGCWPLRARRRIPNLAEVNLPNTEAIANGRATKAAHIIDRKHRPHLG
jgi:hypothetical protein